MKDKFKKYIKYKNLLYLSVTIIVIAFSFYILNKEGNILIRDEQETNSLFYFISGFATAVLAIIAYSQLSGISKNAKAEFLLRVDERWGEKEILDARTIIHKMYLPYKKEGKDVRKLSEDCLYNFITENLSESIIKMSESAELHENFLKLLNYLDFMETIGFLRKNGYIEVEEIKSLCGNSICFNYRIFTGYIEERRKKHERKNKDLYKNFEDLAKEIQKLRVSEEPESKRQ